MSNVCNERVNRNGITIRRVSKGFSFDSMKRCSNCGRLMDISEFGKGASGRYDMCMNCAPEFAEDAVKENDVEYVERCRPCRDMAYRRKIKGYDLPKVDMCEYVNCYRRRVCGNVRTPNACTSYNAAKNCRWTTTLTGYE